MPALRSIRAVTVLAAFFLVAMPTFPAAQERKVARIGVIFNYPAASSFEAPLKNPNAIGLRNELGKLGWTEGRNLDIQWRTWEGDGSRMPGLVKELLTRPVDLLVVFGSATIGEARRQTQTVPIVMGSSTDPVASGLVESLSRPGGNVTGLTLDHGGDIFGKRLVLLKELLPGIVRVAYIGSGDELPSADATARGLGLTLLRYRVTQAREVDAALADAKQKKAAAAVLDTGSAFSNPEHATLIHRYAERHRIPVMHAWLAGGRISYGSTGVDFHAVARYVDRILKGAKPSDLPVQQPSNYRLVVNKKAAKAIGLEIPASILTQADRIIE